MTFFCCAWLSACVNNSIVYCLTMLWNFYFVNVFLMSLSGVIEDNRLPANFF